MSPREALIFERALWMCAREHGNTREQQLAWLNDDEEWGESLEYPLDRPVKTIDGKPAFIQVSRETVAPRELAPPPPPVV